MGNNLIIGNVIGYDNDSTENYQGYYLMCFIYVLLPSIHIKSHINTISNVLLYSIENKHSLYQLVLFFYKEYSI